MTEYSCHAGACGVINTRGSAPEPTGNTSLPSNPGVVGFCPDDRRGGRSMIGVYRLEIARGVTEASAGVRIDCEVEIFVIRVEPEIDDSDLFRRRSKDPPCFWEIDVDVFDCSNHGVRICTRVAERPLPRI